MLWIVIREHMCSWMHSRMQDIGFLQDLVGDIHCIIEATIGRSSDVMLEKPNTDGVPDYVLGDPDRLRGILLNLYTNAAKFTKRGSIALRVRVANKDYRPAPAQVIAQQQRGPNTRVSRQRGGAHQHAAEQEGQQRDHSSWGSINGMSPQKKSVPASQQQSCSRRMASPFSQAPGADPDNILTTASEAWRSGPGAQAATSACMVLHRGHDAQDAANAINQTQDITTPVQAEHLVGQALLQHTAQVIDSAAAKLQADAGLGSVGAFKPQRGRRLQGSDPLESVREDTTDGVQAESRQGLGEVARQHPAAGSTKLSRSSCGRVSSNSVLDQLDDCSSSSGGSAHSDSKAPLPGAKRGTGPTELEEDTQQQDSTDVLDRSHAARPWMASQQGRHSGTGRTALGERTQSNSDISQSDASYRRSSGSFSDYPPPLRQSFSSPPEALDVVADRVVAGQKNATTSGQRRSLGGLIATSYNGMSSGKAIVGKTVATTVQDLGDGWFNTVAHRKSPVLAETKHLDNTHHLEEVHSTDQRPDNMPPSAFQGPMSPAGTAILRLPNHTVTPNLLFICVEVSCHTALEADLLNQSLLCLLV